MSDLKTEDNWSDSSSDSDTKYFHELTETERNVYASLQFFTNFSPLSDNNSECNIEPGSNFVRGTENSCLNSKVTGSATIPLGDENNCPFASSDCIQYMSGRFKEIGSLASNLVNAKSQLGHFSASGEFLCGASILNQESEVESGNNAIPGGGVKARRNLFSVESHISPYGNPSLLRFNTVEDQNRTLKRHPLKKQEVDIESCNIRNSNRASSSSVMATSTEANVPITTVDPRSIPAIVTARNMIYGSTAPTEKINNHLTTKVNNPSNAVTQHKKDENEMIDQMVSEILDKNPNVKFDDVAGLDFIKTTIKEIVIWPFLRPDLFCGLRAPPKGLLLFGPPGTGKTLIGKCIATEANATFFCISASSLTSKYVGEGEKLVRTMFTVARSQAPSVIFIDEIDSLLTQRSGGEQDYARKIKTEFLVQFDGAKTSKEDRILVVGATNRPQEIDEAARRRFVKRLYVPLPDFSARRQIIIMLLSKYSHELTIVNVDKISCDTEGYSCADISNLCQEAAMGPIRSSYAVLATISLGELRPICLTDFEQALKRIKPSVSEADVLAHLEFNKKFGCDSF